jgi:hypothetical protein
MGDIMSKGISWRQRGMLKQLLQRENEQKKEWERDEPWRAKHWKQPNLPWIARPVAWRELDFGPMKNDEVLNTSKGQWNIEQSTRRALRNLEQRGLIELGQYSFMPDASEPERREIPALRKYFYISHIEWSYRHPDEHVPGQSRWMTGVLLTDEGRRLAECEGLAGGASPEPGQEPAQKG